MRAPGGFRHVVVLVVGVLCLAGALLPARADIGGVVTVSRGQFVPGDTRVAGGKTMALVPQGSDVEFVNLDAFGLGPHTMTAMDEDNNILFDSGIVDYQDSAVVKTSSLPAGIYPFYCATHYFHGTLQIV